ncbi:MAG TPA: asparagine synthase-related protein [Thermomicrobiales bacterium]|nr:asparagine synthase-related protein [Thermomicrobiales bacterium]
MSGIIASRGRIDPEQGERMLDRLVHRGPDGSGSAVVGESWLGHRWLAIVEDSQQPIRSEAAGLTLIADGEVYNAAELRDACGDVAFATRDTVETALHLYATSGPEAFAEMDGQFALVTAGDDGRFVAARDPFGLKPLFWARRDRQTLFASELSAYDEDWMPLAEFFPPGHYWTPQEGLVRFAYAVPDAPAMATPFERPEEEGDPIPEEILERVRKELEEAAEQQMMGNAPIGAFLSGGLDSSVIAALAARWCEQCGQRLKTFAVGFEGAPDLAAARVVASHLGTDHYEKTYTADEALEVLPEVVLALENFDPSLVRSSVSNYIVAELAAQHVKVVLCGEGADEIFGGYHYLKEFDSEEALHAELVRGIEGGHNGGFQRVDRTTMIHSLQARMPFMARDNIALGFAIPAAWKLASDVMPEKHVLREAFQGWLPHDILSRKKAQFGEGSGAVDVLQERMTESVTEEELQRERDVVAPPLRTREELAYYRIFAEHFPGAQAEKVVGRFVTA